MARTNAELPGESWSEVILTVGKAVIRAEHYVFVTDSLDNSEHLARIRRIADALARALQEHGQPIAGAEAVTDALVAYGKELFLSEWMSQTSADEDLEAVLAQGREEFDRGVTRTERPVAG